MRRPANVLLVLLPILGGCSWGGSTRDETTPGQDVGNAATVAVGTTAGEDPRDRLARMKAAIRQDAVTNYVDRCGLIDLPDAAFVPVELTGDGRPELAVIYSRARCSEMGATGFSNTGGTMVQFWSAEPEGPVRLLLERVVMGFTPSQRKLTVWTAGSCAGSGRGCRISYRWANGSLEVAAMEPDDADHRQDGQVAFDDREMESQAAGPTLASAVDRQALMRARIRQQVRIDYGRFCGTVDVPDKAIIPVEITGDDLPELAVNFEAVRCPARGATGFSGTGGRMIQFWQMGRDTEGQDEPIRLLLEAQMRGFTPGKGRLVTLQHGIVCPGGAGPDLCQVTYMWDSKSRHLDAAARILVSKLGQVPPMAYDDAKGSFGSR